MYGSGWRGDASRSGGGLRRQSTLDLSNQPVSDLPANLALDLLFSASIDPASAANAIFLQKGDENVDVELTFFDNDKNIRLVPHGSLSLNTDYTLSISNELLSKSGIAFAGQQIRLRTMNGTINLESVTIDDQRSNPFGYLTNISLQPTVQLKVFFGY